MTYFLYVDINCIPGPQIYQEPDSQGLLTVILQIKNYPGVLLVNNLFEHPLLFQMRIPVKQKTILPPTDREQIGANPPDWLHGSFFVPGSLLPGKNKEPWNQSSEER